MHLRDYTFLGTTRSLCPSCRRLVDAKIIVRDGRVYFRKRCPEHGVIEDFVCSDVAYYDRHEFSQPARMPQAFGTRSDKGCPYDCGLCPEHEQHTCIALIEITSNCNLKCPMCFAESGPGGKHIDFATYTRMVDRYVQPRRRRRRAATVRRRADAASRPGAHGPLRLRAADPGRDDQHQRHPPGPRPRPGRAAGGDARPAGNLPAIRRPGGARPTPALRGEELLETKLAALEVLRTARPALHAGLHRRSQHQPARGRPGAALRPGAADRARRQLPAGDLLRPAPRPARPGAARHHARRGQGASSRRRTAWSRRATSTRCLCAIRTAT